MPSWGEIAREIAETPPTILAGVSAVDYVRRKYLATVSTITGRCVIVYATRWTVPNNGAQPSPLSLSINNGDIHGFMEALYKVADDNLDLIIHSPGGSPEAAEAIVLYLRAKFKHIRVFVPHMAMSAATMIACAADEIIMGKHSFIGPIDPQLQLQTSVGARFVPAQAIVEQFNKAVVECQDASKVRAWLPMLAQFGPDLLVTCQNATLLSQKLVSDWLASYMFAGQGDGASKATAIASWLSDHSDFKTHGRPIPRDEARQHGLKVINLEDDPSLQDAVLSVYHAVAHTFSGHPVSKIIENHQGKAFLDMMAPPAPQTIGAFPFPFPFPMRPAAPGPGGQPPMPVPQTAPPNQ